MNKQLTSENGVPGPTFLENFTTPVVNPKGLQHDEWLRKLQMPNGQNRFRIKFYGQLHDGLIAKTEFSEALVYAVDKKSGEEILIFDGCKHGYNALLCHTFTNDQINKRPANNWYKGEEEFELILSITYGFDFEEEANDGKVQLADGSAADIEWVKRNAFDSIQIWGIDSRRQTIEIIAEELA